MNHIHSNIKKESKIYLEKAISEKGFLDIKINLLEKELKQMMKAREIEVRKIESINPFHPIIESVIEIFNKTYPLAFRSPAIQECMNDLYFKETKSLEELKEDISKILFRIYFSKGDDKVYDCINRDYYDDTKCQALFDNGIFIPEEWLHQFIRCLFMHSASEDMLLHNLTPEWLWPRCFPLLMELYQLTQTKLIYNSKLWIKRKVQPTTVVVYF
jgi:hypothetical protein